MYCNVVRADDFTFEALSVGRVQRLKIRHDNAGSSPGWFVESVTVQDLKTYEQFNFPCSQWLAQDQGDGKLERTLIIEGTYEWKNIYVGGFEVAVNLNHDKFKKLCSFYCCSVYN
jgi:PLAT/LH2 domain